MQLWLTFHTKGRKLYMNKISYFGSMRSLKIENVTERDVQDIQWRWCRTDGVIRWSCRASIHGRKVQLPGNSFSCRMLSSLSIQSGRGAHNGNLGVIQIHWTDDNPADHIQSTCVRIELKKWPAPTQQRICMSSRIMLHLASMPLKLEEH